MDDYMNSQGQCPDAAGKELGSGSETDLESSCQSTTH